MKKIYIVPKIVCLATNYTEGVMRQASFSDLGDGSKLFPIEIDDRKEGEEADGAAKRYDAWTAWDE